MGRRGLLPVVSLGGGARQDEALRVEGACVGGQDHELFFDEDRTDEAKAVCRVCPVAQRCLSHAIKNENFGVWGGTTPEERDALRGTKLIGSPEDARWADTIREQARRGILPSRIAADMGVSVRTLDRWLAANAKRGTADAA